MPDTTTPVPPPPTVHRRRALRSFSRQAIVNIIAVAVGLVPSLLLDTLYVLRGQPYDSILNSPAVGSATIAIGLLILFTANWIGARELAPTARFLVSLLVTTLVGALAALPAALVMYWFHLAIGGTE